MSTRALLKKRLKNSKPSGRRHVEKYAGDAYDLALSTAKGLNYIKKLINVEEKYFDTYGASTTVNSSGTVVNAFGISQGTDIANRVGDSVKLQHIRFTVWMRMSTTATRSAIRVILFRDLENPGTAPTVSDVLSGVSTTQSPIVPYNFINTRTRFKILSDELVALSVNGTEDAVSSESIAHSGHVRFRGTTGAASDMAQGSLWLLFLSNETTVNLPDVTYVLRVEFTDD